MLETAIQNVLSQDGQTKKFFWASLPETNYPRALLILVVLSLIQHHENIKDSIGLACFTTRMVFVTFLTHMEFLLLTLILKIT